VATRRPLNTPAISLSLALVPALLLHFPPSRTSGR
jgi:hypothetical protein